VPFNSNPRVPITINGRNVLLALDIAAIASLKEDFDLGLEDVLALARKPEKQLEDPRLLIKLLYSLTRSNDEAPTLKDIERITPHEVFAMQDSLSKAFSAGASFGLKKESPATRTQSGTVSGSASIGGKRLTRRSTGSNSRRAKHGG
jgi:hypothetical protein